MTTDINNARSIRIFLRDGDPRHTRSAEIPTSTTQAIGFRRNQLTKLDGELSAMIKRPGAYILLDGDDASVDREAYIGESEDILTRLKHHNLKGEKEFWEDTLVLVSKDENVTKSHARYMESRLISEAKNNPRWKLPHNGQTPSKTAGRLPLADRVDMERFVMDAKMLVGVLGCDIFRSIRVEPEHLGASNQMNVDESTVVFSLHGKGYDAKMRVSPMGDFIIEAGSIARKTMADTAPNTIKKLRDSLMENDDLCEKGSSLEFKSAYSFSSVSTAAGVVCGFSTNGRTAWKTDEGRKTYGDWEADQSFAPSNDG